MGQVSSSMVQRNFSSSPTELTQVGKGSFHPNSGLTSLIRYFCVVILVAILMNQSLVAPALSTQSSESETRYAKLGLEATDWITSFQVTPLNDSWGIPYQDNRAWGLDPYFFANGTITAGEGGIVGGERQKLAYLIGGHDAGEGANAALDAYLETGDSRYLEIFNVYYGYFQGSQIPGTRSTTPARAVLTGNGENITVNNSGFWAEQASVSAGSNGNYGGDDDRTTLQAVYPAAEHGNPIATTLIAYYRLTHDQNTLAMLNRYGSWLVGTQIHVGEYAGAFPVTQYYWALGWKPRMYETTESAWVLAELYMLTGNKTYLNSAEAAGQYMLSRQFIGPEWENTPVYGALPYEWNETHYTNSVSTNHAGFTILAWTQLFRITGDERYLTAAEKYADWLLSFQVTNTNTNWGNHTYANDGMAIGGFYYGYQTEKHEFGWRVAESLWSASYAIPALLMLSQLTGDANYSSSASLAADWLTQMRYPDRAPVPLQALAIIKYPISSWWGLYPQYYQPDMREVRAAGILSFVQEGTKNASSIRDQQTTWFEKTFGIDFNLIDYEMASRGPTFMKMTWSWWPSIGFEPRYGGDIAFGAFAIDSYLTFNASSHETAQILAQIDQMTGNDTTSLPQNITSSYNEAAKLVTAAQENFNLGWYTIAKGQIDDALTYANAALSELQPLIPLRQNNTTLMTLLAGAVVIILVSNLYWYKRLTEMIKYRRNRQKQRRK
jgi:hypothetical protein